MKDICIGACIFVVNKSRLYTKISEVNISAFIYRLCHEDFSLIVGTNSVLVAVHVLDMYHIIALSGTCDSK